MANFDFSAHKVFMCDTDPNTIDIARSTYHEAGIGDFVATPSPQEAIKQITQMKPDLILMAMKFPEISGIQIVQKVRSINEGEFYKTPILMLLEKVSQNLLREACRAGIEGALRKPIASDKILRFSRAVITKPRRFICVRHYFGPERRSHGDPHFDGQDRRSKEGIEAFDNELFARHRASAAAPPVTPGKSSLGSEPVLNNTQPSETPDWGQSQTKPKADGGVMDYSSDDFKSKSKSTSNGDYDLSDGPATKKSKEPEYDFTSEDRPSAKEADVDFGSSSDKAKDETHEIKPSTEIKAAKKSAPEQPKKVEKKDEPKIEAAPTGPDDDDFEEIKDLDECLDLHKEWINSGGKRGEQINRPNSDFRGQELAESDFSRSIIPQSNFAGVDCARTDFHKSDLSGSTFKDAMLSSADMRVCRLKKADLRNARMDKVNLLGADLSGANLEGATLRGVNLSGANLHLTNLRGVNLASAQGLIAEQIKRAITDQTTRLPLSARTPS